VHKRLTIRNKFVELLTGNTDCGANVFKSRARPFIQAEGWQEELPAIIVYTSDETVTKYDDAPACWRRTPNVVVEIHAAADEDTDDFLDHVAEQVEHLISRYNWEAEDIDFGLSGTRMQLVDAGASQINGALAVTFDMAYYSYLPDEGKTDALDDFLTAKNTYLVGTAESLQTVELP
jgi:hypothetical protein